VPGPDLHAFAPDALAALVSAPYRISPTSDRVGTRLAGPDLPRNMAPERSRPMVRGALEVPRDGQPIVLGPEHPTTGGYPILAVIAEDDLDRFFAIRLGGEVAFQVGHAATLPARS
jgi:allophanate hydrolase subunit 2